MPGRFILSLDCEGKWGIADHIDASSHIQLSDARLRQAYHDILALLDTFEIPATFAFVGAFAETRKDLLAQMDHLRAFEQIAPDYVGPAISHMTQGSCEGWHGDWAVEAVAGAAVSHEIALHGVTHIPWDRLTRRQAVQELDFLKAMQTPVREATTFIYPRNRVAHTDVLYAHRFKAYRKSPAVRSRIASLVREFYLWEKAEPDCETKDGIVAIPAGYFVNWQSGLRRLVPRWLSRARASHIMREAARTNNVVHYWLHPENVASAPATLARLSDILQEVARLRDKDQLIVLTQRDYADGAAAAARQSFQASDH